MDCENLEFINRVSGKIKDLREMLGFSKNAFAEKIGITRTGLAMIEKGDRLPSLVTLSKICNACDLHLRYFIDCELEINHYRKIEDFYSKFKELECLSKESQQNILMAAKIMNSHSNVRINFNYS